MHERRISLRWCHLLPSPAAAARGCALLVSALACAGCASIGGTTEEVAFAGSEGTVLRGTLALPDQAARPLAAVVLLHGAERATRKRAVYTAEAGIFLRRNFAVLVYDKRGAGESGGTYEDTTYSQLVGDAEAAIAYLRGRPEIDPARIGLVGASESGWLTPEIAERSGGLAFIVNKVGPALSWRETVAWEVYHEMRSQGIEERSAREQVDVLRRVWAYYLAPDPNERAALEAELSAWAQRKDSALPAALQEAPHASYLEHVRYDPSPYLERLATPTLFLYGREDVNVPTEACIERLKELAAAGRPVSFHVFEDAGHELGTWSLLPPWYRFLDGYEELVGNFASV